MSIADRHHHTSSRSPRRPRTRAAAALFGVALVAATAGAARARTASATTLPKGAAAHALTVTARDYAFDAPDSVPSGVTEIRLLNKGTELHHVMLWRLDAGRTMADFFAALKAGGPPPSWAHEAGGPNAPAPGNESVATLDLVPGRYAMTCFIPSKDGVPHIMKGMAKEIVAVAPTRAALRPAAYSAPATTITLDDYKFGVSRPLAAGTQTIRIRNAARQAHEIFIVKLAPGKTAHEMAEWAEKQDGPPPGMPIGGTTGIASGTWNDVTVTLDKGEYALLCFWPDAGDGKPHVAHGMMTQFTVR